MPGAPKKDMKSYGGPGFPMMVSFMVVNILFSFPLGKT